MLTVRTGCSVPVELTTSITSPRERVCWVTAGVFALSARLKYAAVPPPTARISAMETTALRVVDGRDTTRPFRALARVDRGLAPVLDHPRARCVYVSKYAGVLRASASVKLSACCHFGRLDRVGGAATGAGGGT